MKELILIYLLTVNALGFVLMLADKRKAQKNKWRIPESTLMLVALIGGSVGCLAGMYTFCHKTRHPKFTVGVPLILALQVVLAVWILIIR